MLKRTISRKKDFLEKSNLLYSLGTSGKNLACGRHWISQPVRLVAPIPKQTEIDKRKILDFTCHMSRVTSHVSHIVCRLSPTTTVTDPPPANYPIMHCRLVCKEQTTRKFQNAKKILKQQKPETSWGMPILAIRSSTRSLETGVWVFYDGTDRPTVLHMEYCNWIGLEKKSSKTYDFGNTTRVW